MATASKRGAGAKRRDPAVSSRILRAVHAEDTGPELALRRALHRRGARYRLHDSRLPGRPDLVFAAKRLAVFVDGDFWHGRGYRERGFASLTEQFAHWNRGAWWLRKIQGNVARDRRVTRSLRRRGWGVIRVRDSVLARSPESAVALVLRALKAR